MNGYTAMDSKFRASAKEEVDKDTATEVRTSAIDREREGRDRRVLSEHWKGREPQHTGLSGDLKPDSGRAGPRQADEGRVPQRLAGGGGNHHPQRPPATTWQQKFRAKRKQCCHPA